MFKDLMNVNNYGENFQTSVAYEIAKHIASDAPVIALQDSKVNYLSFGADLSFLQKEKLIRGTWKKFYCVKDNESYWNFHSEDVDKLVLYIERYLYDTY